LQNQTVNLLFKEFTGNFAFVMNHRSMNRTKSTAVEYS